MGLHGFVTVVTIMAVAFGPWVAQAQLSSSFYASSCPNLQSVAGSSFRNALAGDRRIGASLIRMHFHDCFAQGCDGSVLLNDVGSLVGEQTASPNAGTLRGFNVVANIKSAVEAACPGVVSCADILALAARDAVTSYGGPSWNVQFGRRDSTTACFSCANSQIPTASDSLGTLNGKFGAKGLSQLDMVALAGAHTVGKSHCSQFSGRLNGADPNLNPTLAASLQGQCPTGVSNQVVVDMDPSSNFRFDNNYYSNLQNGNGLFSSDQELQSQGGSTAATVANFAGSQSSFFNQFANSMLKLGNVGTLTGSAGEIRKLCSKTN